MGQYLLRQRGRPSAVDQPLGNRISALGIAPELDRFYTEAHITWLSQYGERLVIEVTRFHRTQEMQHSPMTRTRERAGLLR
jgi:hypothetical protein